MTGVYEQFLYDEYEFGGGEMFGLMQNTVWRIDIDSFKRDISEYFSCHEDLRCSANGKRIKQFKKDIDNIIEKNIDFLKADE